MPSQSDLDKHLAWMYGLERFGVRLGVEVMMCLMTELGNPHHSFKSVHITGTNGKGSTASFISSALTVAGHKTGLYTSPHLYTFNERIRINGQAISDADLVELIQEIRATMEKTKLLVTFFEFTTALAFLYFAKQKIDIAVVEVGMGGDLDATNVVHPLVAVITNIGLDHVGQIGKNKRAIARHKAGIIKPGCAVVTAEQNPSLLKLFESVCKKQHATLYHVSDFYKRQLISSNLKSQTFKAGPNTFTIPLLGQHQVTNATTALLALQKLNEKKVSVSTAHMQRGLKQTHWEGRLDIVSRNPFILVDGAHNNDGTASLMDFLDTAKLPEPDVLVLAIKHGKDMQLMFQNVVPRFREIIITEGTFEPEKAETLAKQVKKYNRNVRVLPKIDEAIKVAKQQLLPQKMLLVTGSLYLVGDALRELRKKG